ncbi:MAG: serine/threonine-protein kinase [Myxococcaceae bacterium]
MGPPPSRGPGVSSWEPGTTVGRYTLVTPLAQGGMAEIWLARQGGLHSFAKLVVIKRLIDTLSSDPESRAMFVTEARLAAQLSHPNVVQITELGEEGSSLYIVMEYLDGEDLASIRRTAQKLGQPLSDHHAVRMASFAAEGLHYAHTLVGHDGRPLKIVHRDVSPQNLIVTFDGALKVVDFGIAKAATAATFSGKLKGKLGYMSPEQARGEVIDGRSDVFSLGVVLFEVLTRSRLMPKMNDLDMLNAMAGDDPLPRPRDRRADLDPGLESIVNKAMERDRERRFQSAREFQESLDGWLRAQNRSVSTAELGDYLRGLFARRIHDRRQLVEQALVADLTPTRARQLTHLAHRDGAGSQSRTRATASRSRGLVASVVAMSLVVLSLGVAIAHRALATEAEPVVKAPPVDTPASTPDAPAAPPQKQVVVVQLPPPKPTVLELETVPTGAAVTIDGEPRGVAPVKLEGLKVGPHDVRATLDGYELATRTVTVAEEGERQKIEIALKAIVVAVAPPPEPLKPEPKASAKKPAHKPAPKQAMGKLTLKTTPWTTVYLGKRKLGDTPLVDMAFPAGSHVLRLVTEAGVENTVQVDVAPNETTVKKLKF